ncbi:MAG: amino acid permease [Thermoplasmata archaeon]|nr:amino acid permease [Thermoplasmata archaeon]
MEELRRELGLKEVVATIMTSVIGGGLFISTIQIQSVTHVGSGIILSYIMAAIPAILVALCYAVLASAMPSSGGEYIFISRLLDPYIGFISTWARWFSMIATLAAMAVGDTILIQNFLDISGWHSASSWIASNIQLIAIIFVVVFVILNYLGIKLYGIIQTVMFVLLMIGIGLFIIFGIPHVSISNLAYQAKFDFSSLAKASSLIFFSYIGFAVIANAGGEVRNPGKTLPKGILLSTFGIAIIYIVMAVITYGSMSPSFYSSYDFSTGSIPDVARYFLPSLIAVYVAFAGSIAIISDINPTILASSRLSFAWAKDEIVPSKLAELNRYKVPKWSLIVTGAMAIAIIIFAKAFMNAVMMINMAVLLVYISITASSFVLPYKHPEIYEKAKFKLRGLWVISLAGMILSALFFGYVLRLDGAMPGFLFLIAWIAIGSVIYALTLERHKLFWRLDKQQRKEKAKIDEKVIREMIKKK